MKNDVTCCCDYLQGSFSFDEDLYKSSFEFFNDLVKLNPIFDIKNFVFYEYKQLYGHYNVKASYLGKQIFYFCFDYDDLTNFSFANLKSNSIYFKLSGDGIRLLQEANCFDSFINYIGAFKTNITRIDCAIDFFNPNNMVVPSLDQAFENYITQKDLTRGDLILQSRMNLDNLKELTNMDPYRKDVRYTRNWTCYNDYSSLGHFKLYDKWLEIKTVKRFKDYADELLKDLDYDYWYRLEYEIVDDRANDMFRLWLDQCNFADVASWCLSKFFVIREFKSKGYDTCRQNEHAYWFDLISLFASLDAISLTSYLTKQKYVHDIQVATARVHRNCTSFFKDLLIAFSVPGLIEDMIKDNKITHQSDIICKYAELRQDLHELCESDQLTNDLFLEKCNALYPLIDSVVNRRF